MLGWRRKQWGPGMRALRILLYVLVAVVSIAIIGVAAIWALNPFAPEVAVTNPAPEGRRITDQGLVANYYPPQGNGKRAGILLLGGSEGGLSPGVGRMAKGLLNPPGGSWSLGGKPIPFLPYARPKQFSGPVVDIYATSLETLAQHQDAIIPVERIRAPVLLICGMADKLWPSCPMADQVKARASASSGPAVTILAYDNAGHAVMGLPVDKSNSNYARLDRMGGTNDGNNDARADGWPKIVAHLEAALTTPSPAQ